MKYHTQTADVNLNNLWNVNVAIFFSHQKIGGPVCQGNDAEEEKKQQQNFQPKTEAKTGREEEED